jgi:hypothetical protein
VESHAIVIKIYTLYFLLLNVRGSSESVKNPICLHLAMGTLFGMEVGEGKMKGEGSDDNGAENISRR